MAKRPLVGATIRTEFGDVLEDASFYDTGGADKDLTYVPGFSDMRRDRDLELAAVASGQKARHEAKIPVLPVNCHWARKTTPRGAPDGRKSISYGNLGYRAATKDMIGKHDWLTEMPPGATFDADGTICKGDTVLMVTDAKNAARNVARRQAETNRMVGAAVDAAGGLMNLGARKTGVDPHVRQEA